MRSRGTAQREPDGSVKVEKKSKSSKCDKSSSKYRPGELTVSPLALVILLLFGGLILHKGFKSFASTSMDDVEREREITELEIMQHVATKPSIYSLTVPDIHGAPTPLSQYNGFVTLIVNVACAWGKTEVSYKQLTELQHKYGERKFSVLAFPSNDFHQERGSNEEIEAFVNLHYPDYGFQIFQKSSLKDNVVYQTLKMQLEGNVKGNFFKYLVNRNGEAVALYAKKQTPFSFESDIVRLLDEQ